MRAIIYEWDGDAMVPLPHLAHLCDKQFVVHERYRLGEAPEDERSQAAHNRYMAHIGEAWHQLPEALKIKFPSPTHLRKWALIEAGYYTSRVFGCPSLEDGARAAAVIKELSPYIEAIITENVVEVRVPKSQKQSGPGRMGKKEFNESAAAVEAVIAGLVGVTVAELQANAGRAA